MILRGGHAERFAVRHERQKRTLGTHQAFFNNNFCTGSAKCTAEAIVHGLKSIFKLFGNNNAFTCGKAIGLHYNRGTQLIHVGKSIGLVVKAAITRRGNVVRIHEFLAKGLASFKLSAIRIGAEHQNARRTQIIGHAGNQGSFRTNNYQVNCMFRLLAKRQNALRVVDIKTGHVLRNARRTTIAGRNVQTLYLRRLCKRPGHSMFATTRAQYQYIHSIPFVCFSCLVWSINCICRLSFAPKRVLP